MRMQVFVLAAAGIFISQTPQGHAAGRPALPTTILVNTTSDGLQADVGAYEASPRISGNGRYVVFTSSSRVFVPGDTNETADVFRKDLLTGTVERINLTSGGAEANQWSTGATVSADGRYVAFVSYASNLVEGDSNDQVDVFVHDVRLRTTERVNVSSSGEQAAASTWGAQISPDGRYVAFVTTAPNLVPNDNNADPSGFSGGTDVFVRDLRSHTTERVSLTSVGTEIPGGVEDSGFCCGVRATISSNGRYVTYNSGNTGIVAGDTNGAHDIYLVDRQRHTTRRITLNREGEQANAGSLNPVISADGGVVAFASFASNLVSDDTNGDVDFFAYDVQRGVVRRASVASDGTQMQDHGTGWMEVAVSRDGRFLAFQSMSPYLVPDDTNGTIDIFVHDFRMGTTERASLGEDGSQANDHSFEHDISGDGSVVVFVSWANNLLTEDINGVEDVFARMRILQRKP